MLEYRFQLNLIDPLVVSAAATTVGQHDCLPYVPGATLRGVAAARLYQQLPPDEQWTVFHSGDVRFGDARLLDSEHQPAAPMPLAWHGSKGTPSVIDGRVASSAVYNLACPDHGLASDQQPVQMRDGYLGSDGLLQNARHAYRMKTAIDPTTGTAAQSQLFGYTSLNAGQRLGGHLSIDAKHAKAAWLPMLLDSLRGNLRVGRSRSAQYGRAHCDLTQVDAPPQTRAKNAHAIIWLMSDLCVLDAHGQPTLAPTLADLVAGLPALPMLLGSTEHTAWRSFVRTRRYAPFNAHRRLPEPEREVLKAGSVLCYASDALDDKQWQTLVGACGRHLGLYRECGLGEVRLNDALLTDARPHFAAPAPDARPGMAPGQVSKPQTPLIAWLTERADSATATHKRDQRVDAWVEELQAMYLSAMRLTGADATAQVGPSASQWGEVRAIAQHAADMAQLKLDLFGQDTGYCRVRTSNQPAKDAEDVRRSQGWDGMAPARHGNDAAHFNDWFANAVVRESTHAREVAEFARRAIQTVKHIDAHTRNQGDAA